MPGDSEPNNTDNSRASASEEELGGGRDARAPVGARFFNPYSDIAVHKHWLPHWQQDEVFYFIT